MGPKKVSVVFELRVVCDQDAPPFLRISHTSFTVILEALSCQDTTYVKIRASEDRFMVFQRLPVRTRCCFIKDLSQQNCTVRPLAKRYRYYPKYDPRSLPISPGKILASSV
jgi:hypothetical protein